MRFHDLVACVLALAGCNPVFGLEPTVLFDAAPPIEDDAPLPPDRDRDGIFDEQDPCIASIADPELDSDGDAYANGVDFCPMGYDDTDMDGDLVADECDPYPALAGDRKRCVMAFANARINRDLWTVRDGDANWDLISANGLSAIGTGSLVAQTSFEAPVTSDYNVPLALAAMPVGSMAMFTVWARASNPAAASDIGCVLRGDTTGSSLAITGEPPLAVAAPINRATEVQLTVQPGTTGADNIRCRVRFQTSLDVSVGAEVSFAPGTFGVSIENAFFKIYVLTIHERDDAPPL